jgi:hypothetical protein
MKKVIITCYGPTMNDLAIAAEHAVQQLEMGTPSENTGWEDGTHVDFTVQNDSPTYEQDSGIDEDEK